MKYLVEILDKEKDVYSSYLNLATEKKQALIDNSYEKIEIITEAEKNLSTKILALEAARIEFLREQGFPKNIHINDLIKQVNDEDRQAIETSVNNLRLVLKECKQFHDSNMSLLKQASNYVNHMIKIFSSNLNAGRTPAIYSKGGSKIEIGRIADMQG